MSEILQIILPLNVRLTCKLKRSHFNQLHKSSKSAIITLIHPIRDSIEDLVLHTIVCQPCNCWSWWCHVINIIVIYKGLQRTEKSRERTQPQDYTGSTMSWCKLKNNTTVLYHRSGLLFSLVNKCSSMISWWHTISQIKSCCTIQDRLSLLFLFREKWGGTCPCNRSTVWSAAVYSRAGKIKYLQGGVILVWTCFNQLGIYAWQMGFKMLSTVLNSRPVGLP